MLSQLSNKSLLVSNRFISPDIVILNTPILRAKEKNRPKSSYYTSKSTIFEVLLV